MGEDYGEGPVDAQGNPITFDQLVTQVKELQRKDPIAREQWNQFTDFGGGGKRDPAKHSAQFLQAFMQHLVSGVPKMLAEEDSVGLSDAVKLMQKKSPSFKSIWATFCLQFGNGKNDPAKHESTYHVKFFDYLAQQAAIGASMNPVDPATLVAQGIGGNPLKRMRDSSGMPVATGYMEPGKEELVQRIKNFQRMGEPQKELWGTYADLYLGGIRDPFRHDAATLDEFCRNHQVPELSTVSPADVWAASGGQSPVQEPMDPHKEQLVARVKAFQRHSKEQSDCWAMFCGHTRDPARHEAAKLEEFIQTYNIP